MLTIGFGSTQKKFFYCRTAERREQIIRKYDLTPIAHVTLLNGQKRKSCTGNTLEGAYYCFSYKEKYGEASGSFFCGTETGNHFMDLINSKRLPVFNPLKSKRNEDISILTRGETNAKDKKVWHPASLQLFNAINLLIICLDTSIGTPLDQIMNKIIRYSDRPPFQSQVKAVNTIISKDSRNRKLSEMLVEISEFCDTKHYEFNLLRDILSQENIESRF